jgi:hypothetical protein
MRSQSAQFGANENGLALLLGDLDHRIRNSFTMIEGAAKLRHSTSVEEITGPSLWPGLPAFRIFRSSKATTAVGLGLLRCLRRPCVLYRVKNEAELSAE